MRRKLEDAVNTMENMGADYADIRFQEGISENIEVKNDKVEEVGHSRSKGIGMRAFYRGVWGFASTNNMEKLGETAERALKSAKALRKSSNIEKFQLDEMDPVDEKIESDASVYPSFMSMDEKLALMEDAERSIRYESNNVRSSEVNYSDYEGKYLFANSEGSFIEKEKTFFAVYLTCTAKEGDRMESYRERAASINGLEELNIKDPVLLGKKAARMADKLLKAGKPPSGRMSVVLGDRIGGLFAHEAVGHAAEADTVLSRDSVLEGRKGEMIASEKVNLVENPRREGFFGSYRYDDEGVISRKTDIIEEGRLNSFIHSRETSSRRGEKPTGNGRAQSYSSRPLVRMSNTYFKEGDASRGEMAESINEGILVEGFKGGQVSTKEGNFTFGATHGYLIEDGELKEMVKTPNISGRTLKVLKNVSMVGGKNNLGDPGFCGKGGQTVKTDSGAPEMKVDKMVIG